MEEAGDIYTKIAKHISTGKSYFKSSFVVTSTEMLDLVAGISMGIAKIRGTHEVSGFSSNFQ